MAEPIGLASGLLTLTTFALQSSITLYETVQSFRNHPKRVRDLEGELQALSNVLHTLTDTVSAPTDVDLSALNHPLLQCGKACKEFKEELEKCSSRSGGNRTSFRDWARLKYLGDDIDGFRQLLAGYKATINIALTDANLRKSAISAQTLQSHRELIQSATDDLEARLEAIDEKIEKLFARTATDAETAELRRIKEERLSTQKCLLICAQVAEHIKQIQPNPSQHNESSPETITSKGLQDCKTSLNLVTTKLESRMQDLFDQLLAKTTTGTTQEDMSDLAKLREEWTTARECREILSKADDHVKETVSIIDNHASGDETVQFLVSTSDKTIHGKNRGYGFQIRQIGGHIDGESLQQLSRDISRISVPNIRREGSMQDDMSSGSEDAGKKPPHDRPLGYGYRTKDAPEPNMNSKRPPKLDDIRQNSSQKRSGSGL